MRRILAALLCICLLLPLLSASSPSYAVDSYLITIAEDTVLEQVGDSEMAVYIDGIIYIPYTTIREMNSVYVNYNKTEQLVTVFSVGATIGRMMRKNTVKCPPPSINTASEYESGMPLNTPYNNSQLNPNGTQGKII